MCPRCFAKVHLLITSSNLMNCKSQKLPSGSSSTVLKLACNNPQKLFRQCCTFPSIPAALDCCLASNANNMLRMNSTRKAHLGMLECFWVERTGAPSLLRANVFVVARLRVAAAIPWITYYLMNGHYYYHRHHRPTGAAGSCCSSAVMNAVVCHEYVLPVNAAHPSLVTG